MKKCRNSIQIITPKNSDIPFGLIRAKINGIAASFKIEYVKSTTPINQESNNHGFCTPRKMSKTINDNNVEATHYKILEILRSCNDGIKINKELPNHHLISEVVHYLNTKKIDLIFDMETVLSFKPPKKPEPEAEKTKDANEITISGAPISYNHKKQSTKISVQTDTAESTEIKSTIDAIASQAPTAISRSNSRYIENHSSIAVDVTTYTTKQNNKQGNLITEFADIKSSLKALQWFKKNIDTNEPKNELPLIDSDFE